MSSEFQLAVCVAAGAVTALSPLGLYDKKRLKTDKIDTFAGKYFGVLRGIMIYCTCAGSGDVFLQHYKLEAGLIAAIAGGMVTRKSKNAEEQRKHFKDSQIINILGGAFLLEKGQTAFGASSLLFSAAALYISK